MSSIVLRAKSDPDGKLHFEVPVGQPDTEFEVELVMRSTKPECQSWPKGYFDLFGSIDDDTLVRPAPGELPPPVVIE